MPRGRDLLLVDDNPTIRRWIEAALREAGHDVVAVGSVDEALAAAQARPPELILVDSHLATGSGAAVLEAMRGIANLAHVPALALLARSDDKLSQLATDALRKPFPPEALAAAIGSTLARGPGDRRALPSDAPPPRAVVLDSEDALLGRLELVALPDILQLLASQDATGTLLMHADRRAVAFAFHAGKVDLGQLVSAPEPAFRLGRYIAEEANLDPVEIDGLLDGGARRDGAQEIGTLLVRRGLIDEATRDRCLVRQSTDLLVEVLRVGRGVFRFRPGIRSQAARAARLGLHVPGLVLDALRRLDEWRLLEVRVQAFDAVLQVDPLGVRALDASTLTREEQSFLDALDGVRDLRAVGATLGEPPLAIARLAHQLLGARAVRLAPSDPPRSEGTSA